MSDVVQPAYLYVGHGEVYIDRFDAAGLPTGERFGGEIDKVALSVEEEDVRKYGHTTAASPLLKRAVTRRTYKGAIQLSEHGQPNLALWAMGTESTLVQSSGSGVAWSVTSSKKDRWFKLTDRQLSTFVMTTPAGKTLNVDYKLDLETGRIYFMPTGTITDGTACSGTYTKASIAAMPKVIGATAGTIEGSIRVIGRPVAGPIIELEIWRASLSPDGELGLIGDDFSGFSINAEILDDSANHPTEPYYRLLERTA